MTLNDRIEAFIILGKFLKQFQEKEQNSSLKNINDKFYDRFNELINQVNIFNPWFTKEFVRISIANLAAMLTERNLHIWLEKYPKLNSNNNKSKNIGVVLAGNIPMVGFHDILCVLISGNRLIGKLSSKDNKLLVEVSKVLIELQSGFEKLIILEETALKNIDAIIATGSDNSSRYFEYYFNKYPHIIRKNRNSIAILDGNESKEDLENLSDDIFLFFGMGCRNVSKLMLPQNYDIDPFYKAMEKYSSIFEHHKYANNYQYNRTLLLMNNDKHYDNGFLLLKEDKNIASPLSVIHYETYSDIKLVEKQLKAQEEKIQCIVSNIKINNNIVPLGKTQMPELWDYADNIDTLDFLSTLTQSNF